MSNSGAHDTISEITGAITGTSKANIKTSATPGTAITMSKITYSRSIQGVLDSSAILELDVTSLVTAAFTFTTESIIGIEIDNQSWLNLGKADGCSVMLGIYNAANA